LPYDLEAALKEEAAERGRPWQTVLKELLYESLGIVESSTEIKRTSSASLSAAAKQLKRKL
jgi:hypothetical protein